MKRKRQDPNRLRFGNRSIGLPRSRMVRIGLGVSLVGLGLFGILPVLGFWMIPLGLIVLSVDLPGVRKWRRRMTLRFGKWMRDRHPALWRRFGGGHAAAPGASVQSGRESAASGETPT